MASAAITIFTGGDGQIALVRIAKNVVRAMWPLGHDDVVERWIPSGLNDVRTNSFGGAGWRNASFPTSSSPAVTPISSGAIHAQRGPRRHTQTLRTPPSA